MNQISSALKRVQRRTGIKIVDAVSAGNLILYLAFSKDPDAKLLAKRYHNISLTEWARIFGKDGKVFLARGMHNLPNKPKSLASIKHQKTSSWSYNAAYAADQFARQSERHYFDVIYKQYKLGKLEEPFASLFRSIRGKVTYASFTKAAAAILLTSRVDLTKPGNEFGGDSESGPFMEAEVYAKCNAPSCYEHIFLASHIRYPGIQKATKTERRKYCLGYYDVLIVNKLNALQSSNEYKPAKEYELILPADCDFSIAKKYIVEHQKIRKDPHGRIWYKLK